MRTGKKSFNEVRKGTVTSPMLHNRRTVVQGLLWGCVAASGKDPVERKLLDLGGASIELNIHDPETFALPSSNLVTWVRQAGEAVSGYFGRFPVRRAQVNLFPGSHEHRISGGKSFGGSPPMCRINVGRQVTPADLSDDWMLTHEMVHFGFPSVDDNHHWIEEGSATYVEPIARARIGQLTPERVWGDMVRDMPQGLPESGDEGLDNTHTWGRTYWGGALFCLLADVSIRDRTKTRKGLEDALRAINRAGGTIDVDWPLERALAIGDRATGGTTLTDLYRQMSSKPAPVDLPALWTQLGVRRNGQAVSFDENAPLAAVRRSIMTGSKS